jgi:hypothetical protein
MDVPPAPPDGPRLRPRRRLEVEGILQRAVRPYLPDEERLLLALQAELDWLARFDWRLFTDQPKMYDLAITCCLHPTPVLIYPASAGSRFPNAASDDTIRPSAVEDIILAVFARTPSGDDISNRCSFQGCTGGSSRPCNHPLFERDWQPRAADPSRVKVPRDNDRSLKLCWI